MSDKKLFPISLSLGISAGIMALASTPVSAVQLTQVNNFGGSLTELWGVEAQIGGLTDKELFLSTKGATGTNPVTADWTWADAKVYDWRLVWDGNFATFTLFDGLLGSSNFKTIKYDAVNKFVNGLEIKTRVDSRDITKVEAGTKANLALKKLNGEDISGYSFTQSNATGVAGLDTWHKLYIGSNDFGNAFTLEGSTFFDWPSFNPQTKSAKARLAFQIEANYDPTLVLPPPSSQNVASSLGSPLNALAMTSVAESVTSVPEPASVVGFGSVLLGLGLVKRRRQKG